MSTPVFTKLRAINALICVRVDFQSARLDRRTALDTDSVITGVQSQQCRRNFCELVSSLVTQRVDNFMVFELLCTLFRVGFITTPQIRTNAIKACCKFSLFGFENPSELLVSAARHPVLPHRVHA